MVDSLQLAVEGGASPLSIPRNPRFRGMHDESFPRLPLGRGVQARWMENIGNLARPPTMVFIPPTLWYLQGLLGTSRERSHQARSNPILSGRATTMVTVVGQQILSVSPN